MEGALNFIKGCQGIEAVLVGVVTVEELREVLQVWGKTMDSNPRQTKTWAWYNLGDIDPLRCTTQ